MTTRDVLLKAQQLIKDGEWVQGVDNLDTSKGRYCAGTAMRTAAKGWTLWCEANAVFKVANLIYESLHSWNDCDGRTKDDILKAFDIAIAALDGPMFGRIESAP